MVDLWIQNLWNVIQIIGSKLFGCPTLAFIIINKSPVEVICYNLA